MKRPATILMLALLGATATGCVYVDGERVSSDHWRDEQRVNRAAIAGLALGTYRADVLRELGTPIDSEAFDRNGEEVRVLFYRTRHRNSDGETTRDETTPLVFENERLVGWGEAVYADLRR